MKAHTSIVQPSKKTTLFAVVVIVLGAILLYTPRLFKHETTWYVVHLAGNELYFGHILSVTDTTLELGDAHYVKAYKAPTEVSQSKSFILEQNPDPTFSLLRFGEGSDMGTNHAVYLNRTNISYWEELSPQSAVYQMLTQEASST